MSNPIIGILSYNLVLQWFVDKDVPGELQLYMELNATAETVDAGGALVLMQEQDNYCQFLVLYFDLHNFIVLIRTQVC